MEVKSEQLIFGAVVLIGTFLLAHYCFAASVDEMMVDASDYISHKLIPVTSGLGVGIGGILAATGNPKGFEILKWSIAGGIIGSAGVETLHAVFF